MRNAHDDSSTASLQEAIASLHLPHMPETHDAPPTLRILVVADIDLASASALSEYTLNWNNSSKSIDLCIACGPFCRDDDLIPYLQGSQHRRRKRIYRSKEQAAGLEGLMTAALSQLESIVCRVVYCPGLTDPLTVLQQHRRLTPNSRNIHQQWLQLVPGLGCAGLLYLEQTTVALEAPTEEDRSDENGDEEEEKDEELSWAEQLRHLQHSSRGYCATLEQLIKLAPSSSTHPLPLESTQTILVTHYVDNVPVFNADSNPVIGSPLWAVEAAVNAPWPTDHGTFLQSTTVQQLLCLEIASGSTQRKPELIADAKKQILLPGSLRERGEFCILVMGLERKQRFGWNIRSVDFHNIHHRQH